MKKIITLAIICATTPQIANCLSLALDYCTTAGVTTGDTCTIYNANTNVIVSNTCTSASSGCTYKNCSSIKSCRCTSAACPTVTTTNCSDVTCNPSWGDIDYTTHIQTGKSRIPDTTNNCACKDNDGGYLGTTLYRCIAGYYDNRDGITMIGTKPTCKPCRTLGNNNVAGQSDPGTNENPTNIGITSCYIPYNTPITDDTGTYIFVPSIHYLNSNLNGCDYTN